MKLFFPLILLSFFSGTAFAKWGSVTTDLKNDCLVISSATDNAPIDFYKAECKSFAGFSLFIEGGDLRYGPELKYNGIAIDLMRPMHFHDMAEEKIEWFYDHQVDDEGLGDLRWQGVVYSLYVATDDGEKDVVTYYAVALNSEKSCVTAITDSKEKAVETLKEEKRSCLENYR